MSFMLFGYFPLVDDLLLLLQMVHRTHVGRYCCSSQDYNLFRCVFPPMLQCISGELPIMPFDSFVLFCSIVSRSLDCQDTFLIYLMLVIQLTTFAASHQPLCLLMQMFQRPHVDISCCSSGDVLTGLHLFPLRLAHIR